MGRQRVGGADGGHGARRPVDTIGTVPKGTREDAQRAIAAANDPRRRSGQDALRLRAGRRAQARRRSRRGAPRGARAHADARPGQATRRRGLRRGRRAGGVLAERRRRTRRGSRVRCRRPWMQPSACSCTASLEGVVGVITPWNWPYTMPAEVIGPALGAGNGVVWVPAPSTSFCAVLAECVVEAELPAGVFIVFHWARGSRRRRARRRDPGTTASPLSAQPRPDIMWRREGRANRSCLKWVGTGRL